MRQIVAGLFISLDGVVEQPQQWTGPYFNEEVAGALASATSATDTMLLGRRTYEEFAAFWPDRAGEDAMAAYMNQTPKLVVSTTLDTVSWENSTLVKGDIAEELRSIKHTPGGNIQVTGSPTLVRWLLREDLLDELALMVHPVVLGRGRRLFEDQRDQRALELIDTRDFTTGVVSVRYRPARR